MRRDIFQAIADPTRRAILVLLAVHATTPNAVAENFKSTRQAVSKHLRTLTECDLVRKNQVNGKCMSEGIYISIFYLHGKFILIDILFPNDLF